MTGSGLAVLRALPARIAFAITFAAGLLNLPGAALGFQPAEGIFTARAACPAVTSIRTGSNPGSVAVAPGKTYRVVALNRPDGEHVLVETGGEPSRRWVPRACGVIAPDGNPVSPLIAAPQDAGAPPRFAPFFTDEPRRGDPRPAPPRLSAFDRAILDACGSWGARPSRSALTAALADAAHEPELSRIHDALDGRVRGPRLSRERFIEELAALWFAEGGFGHVFCGEPGEETIGGLHFAGRFLDMQERGWGGAAPCRAEASAPPVHTIGVLFRTPRGRLETACPKSFASDLDAAGLLIEATRAFRAISRHRPGERSCLHRVDSAKGSYWAVMVARSGAIRTFYPNVTPRCDLGRPGACACDVAPRSR